MSSLHFLKQLHTIFYQKLLLLIKHQFNMYYITFPHILCNKSFLIERYTVALLLFHAALFDKNRNEMSYLQMTY